MNPDTEKNAEHLRLLSIFHYVYAGITALFSCFPLIYVGMGVAIFTGAFKDSGDSPPGFVGGLFALFGLVGFVFVLAMAGLAAYAGKCLSERKRYTYCIVVAAISCLSVPFGTALGVFTIVVLQRPGVRAMFGTPSTPQT